MNSELALGWNKAEKTRTVAKMKKLCGSPTKVLCEINGATLGSENCKLLMRQTKYMTIVMVCHLTMINRTLGPFKKAICTVHILSLISKHALVAYCLQKSNQQNYTCRHILFG